MTNVEFLGFSLMKNYKETKIIASEILNFYINQQVGFMMKGVDPPPFKRLNKEQLEQLKFFARHGVKARLKIQAR